ncbi:MAG: hypothetical protein J3K34DRAFT_438049 [Monoraphidium minutum]|nr:MAG: hypothetical protein J3K34DRAFT_438049 [Monoraphidium minutum]
MTRRRAVRPRRRRRSAGRGALVAGKVGAGVDVGVPAHAVLAQLELAAGVGRGDGGAGLVDRLEVVARLVGAREPPLAPALAVLALGVDAAQHLAVGRDPLLLKQAVGVRIAAAHDALGAVDGGDLAHGRVLKGGVFHPRGLVLLGVPLDARDGAALLGGGVADAHAGDVLDGLRVAAGVVAVVGERRGGDDGVDLGLPGRGADGGGAALKEAPGAAPVLGVPVAVWALEVVDVPGGGGLGKVWVGAPAAVEHRLHVAVGVEAARQLVDGHAARHALGLLAGLGPLCRRRADAQEQHDRHDCLHPGRGLDS